MVSEIQRYRQTDFYTFIQGFYEIILIISKIKEHIKPRNKNALHMFILNFPIEEKLFLSRESYQKVRH